MLDRQHPRVTRARSKWLRVRGAFLPAQISAVSAWLRLSQFTDVGTLSIPDLLSDNPATQATAGKKPVMGLSANGLVIADFQAANSQVLIWPLTATNNQTTKTGFACWLKPSDVAGTEEIFAISDGASARKLQFIKENSRIGANILISGGDGRQFLSPVAALATGTWAWVRLAYDSSGATEDDRCKLYVNGTLQVTSKGNIGAGGTIGVLPTVTGNALIGGNHPTLANQAHLNATAGPNMFVIEGDITAAQDTALMNFERPT